MKGTLTHAESIPPVCELAINHNTETTWGTIADDHAKGIPRGGRLADPSSARRLGCCPGIVGRCRREGHERLESRPGRYVRQGDPPGRVEGVPHDGSGRP